MARERFAESRPRLNINRRKSNLVFFCDALIDGKICYETLYRTFRQVTSIADYPNFDKNWVNALKVNLY